MTHRPGRANAIHRLAHLCAREQLGKLATMRHAILALALAACSQQPAPADPAPLPPDRDVEARPASPAAAPSETAGEVAPPTDDRARAAGGKLAGADGKSVEMADTWTESNVVVVFYRGAWCKLCRKHLTELQKSYKDLLHAGVHLYAVSTDDAATARQMAKELGLEYPVLSDPGGGVTRAWGVLDESNGIARPATFLIARGGAVAHRDVGHTPGDQPHGYALLEQIKQHLRTAESPE